MTPVSKDDRAIAQLLKTADLRAQELRVHLADLETQKASAETALDWLQQTVRAEEIAAAERPEAAQAFHLYLEAADARRRALAARRDQLTADAAEIAGALAEAFMETRKLECLLEARRSTRAAEAARAADRRADEAAAIRRRG
jgi:chromosome segregation ATPase